MAELIDSTDYIIINEDVVGSGGGSSKGAPTPSSAGRSPVEDPDTLASKASVKIIDLLGEGKIGGLVNGAKSIYLNDTPLMADSGAYNFSDVTWSQRDGSPNQSVIPGFSSVETPFDMGGINVPAATPQTFSITNLNADRVRVIMSIPALMKQDTTTGDMHGNSVTYHFEVSKNGGAYAQIGSPITITGKTKSKYQRSHVFTLPQPVTSGWTIKVVRDSPDETSAAAASATHLDSYAEIVDVKLNYANSAIVSIGLNPETFSSIPSRAYLVKGLYIRVPSNYNAAAKTYSGIWDGSFIVAVSSNPAWILFDLLTTKRYGLGNYLSDAQVDKAMLYTIGRYCDEMIPNGFGGGVTEPRFAINTVIQTQAEAYRVIADITSAFRGMAWWGGGMMGFRQDSPANATMTFNQANVVGGEFNYTGSSRRDRHSVVNVTWNDPTAQYKQRVEYVEDHEQIVSFGIKKIDTVAFGCTSRGQAHRVGKWILYSERYEANLITFKAGLDASLLMPGEVVRIADAFRAGKRMGGRVLSSTLTSVTTDAPVVLSAGAVSLFIAMPDGSFAQRTVDQTNGTFSTFTWTTALPSLPVTNALFAFSDQIVPMLARVISVSQDAKVPDIFTVTTAEHNPNKYAAIEGGVFLTQPPTIGGGGYVVIISGVSMDETTYFLAPGVIGTKLHVSWQGRASLFRISYRLTVNGGSSNWITVDTKIASFDIQNLKDGTIVDVKISGMSPLGKWSIPVTATKTILGKSAPPGLPTGLAAEPMIRSIALTWVNPPDIDLSHVEIYMGLTNLTSGATVVNNVRGISYTVQGLPPSASTRYFWLKAVDTSGNKSGFSAIASASTLYEAGYMVDLLAGLLGTSALNVELGTRIGKIDGPAGTEGTVAWLIAQEAAARGTAILNEANVRISATNSLAQTIQVLVASTSLGYDTVESWKFSATTASWTASGATLAWAAGKVTLSSESTTPQLISPTGLTVDGSKYAIVKINLKRTAGAGWDGTLYYTTSGHGFSATYKLTLPVPTPFAVGDEAILTFDMSKITDWAGNTITQLRFDLGNTAADVFDIDAIYIGRNEPPASTAGLIEEQTARTTAVSAVVSTITALTTTVNDNTATLAIQASSINGIEAKYTVKIDINGYIAGFGLIATANNGAVVSHFAIRADRFSIANPAGPGAFAPVVPFMVLSTPTTIDGTVFPPGVYMKNAMITKLTADQIDTRGLTIRDDAGTIIFSSGVPISKGNINFGVGSNLIPNSDLSAGAGNWILSFNPGGGTNYDYGRDIAGIDWQPAHGHTIGAYRSGTAQAASDTFNLTLTKRINIIPGARYEVSAYLAAHRCLVTLYASWGKLGAGGAETIIRTDSMNGLGATGGQNLADWDRVGDIFDAPIDATFLKIAIGGGAATAASPYFWATKFFMARAGASQTALSAWGGVGSSGLFSDIDMITGVNISTYIEAAAIGTAYIGNASITNAKIANLAVKTANIDDLSVNTLKIAGNAVTIPIAAMTASAMQVGNSYTTVQSVTINSSGAPVLIRASAFLNNSYFMSTNAIAGFTNRGDMGWGWVAGVRLLRDSAVLTEVLNTIDASIDWRDTPGAGSHTYYLQVKYILTWDASICTVSNRVMSLLEVKK